MDSLFLKALACQNKGGHPPVWLMRQAGRYLPEYRELRRLHSLHEMFHTPELAFEATLQPLKRFSLDAAIVFSDILLILESLGFTVHFPEGERPYAKCDHSVGLKSVKQVLSYVARTIERLKTVLSVPLIGFCGGPYTVSRYLLQKSEVLPQLLDQITQVSIEYLQMQEESGVNAIQIFDSWAGLLSKELFHEYCMPYLERLVKSVSIPVILFMRGGSSYVEELVSLKPAGISFDSEIPLSTLRKEVPAHIAVQGNIAPEVLLGSAEEVRAATLELVKSMNKDPGFIANLGHGILKNTPVENVQIFTETVDLFRN